MLIYDHIKKNSKAKRDYRISLNLKIQFDLYLKLLKK